MRGTDSLLFAFMNDLFKAHIVRSGLFSSCKASALTSGSYVPCIDAGTVRPDIIQYYITLH